jgi:ribosomal protein L16 Arg81 hydroxylase
MLSFEWLIDAIAPEVFFRDYYERASLLVEGRSPTKFASLLSVAAIDRYLATATPCHPDVFLVDAARELKVEDYAFPESEPPGRLDLPRVYQLFASGATISLGQMQDRIPELAALCRAVEKTFSSHFQTNIYLSPPNAQGFKTHFDSHDVFVLQVSGSKHWSIYDTLIELPLHGQRFEPDKHIPGPVTRELTLKAGDLFYCPRGLFHSARSTDETSLHITLGLMGKTWADVMTEAISEACLASPEFRRNLPVGFANAGFDRSAAAATFRSLLETLVGGARLDPIFERIAEGFVTSRRPDLRGCLQEVDVAPQVTAESRVSPRQHIVYQLREEGESIVILFGSTQITLPSFAREAVEAALEGETFTAGDLPGQLDDDGKVVLVRRLIKEGLLIRREGAGRGTPPRAAEIELVSSLDDAGGSGACDPVDRAKAAISR